MADEIGEDVVMASADSWPQQPSLPSETVAPSVEASLRPQPEPQPPLADVQQELPNEMIFDRQEVVAETLQPATITSEMPPLSRSQSSSDSEMTELDISSEDFDYTPPKGLLRPEVMLYPRPKLKALPYSTSQSGVVYDTRMRFHSEISGFDEDYHPEDPRRILEIYEELKDAGLIPDVYHPSSEDEHRLWEIAAREATVEEICFVHTRQHFEWVSSLCEMSNEELVEEAVGKDSIYMNQLTFLAAKLSAGGTIEACDAVVAGRVRNVVAVVRPPGHHAEREKPGGFCFFDNVAIATRYCQKEHPDTCRKVLILDWDVHHGNGIQQAFYDDPNVLYISVHVHMNGSFYPLGDYGDHMHCGDGVGLGYNVNIPWTHNGMGDGDYLYAFQRVIMPIAQEFDPDLVVVAAGFDAADGDDLGGCHVSPAGYAHMTHMLMSLAKGKIAVVLEGGYNLRSIAKSALAVTKTLMGEPPDRLPGSKKPEPSPSGIDTVHRVIRQQSRFWKRVFPQDVGTILKNRVGGIETANRVDQVVRRYQMETLWEKHRMRPLPIVHEKYAKLYENQVLATPNYEDVVPLLVILHDPPEVIASADARTGKLELHNAWLADATKLYVDWAVQNGFAVMDVNIPKHFAAPGESHNYIESLDEPARALAARELCTYLWQNYICPNEAQYLFFLGIGDAYSGLLHLLSTDEYLANATDFIYSFLAEHTLQSVRRNDDGSLGDWYRRHSMVFVSAEHAVWDPARGRKLPKKYGRLFRSPHADLNEMLAAHRQVVFDDMLAQTATWRAEQAELALAKKKIQEEAKAVAEAANRAGLDGGSATSSKTTGVAPTLPNGAVADTARLVTPTLVPMSDGGDVAMRSGVDIKNASSGHRRSASGGRRPLPSQRAGRSTTPTTAAVAGDGGNAAVPKLPPLGTFEVTASPQRSPARRPPL